MSEQIERTAEDVARFNADMHRIGQRLTDVRTLKQRNAKLRTQRDKLASALKAVMANSACPLGQLKADRFAAACSEARAALASCEPSTHSEV